MPLFPPPDAFPLSTLREYIFFTDSFFFTLYVDDLQIFHFCSVLYNRVFHYCQVPRMPITTNHLLCLQPKKKNQNSKYLVHGWIREDWRQLVDCMCLTVYSWLWVAVCSWLTWLNVFVWLNVTDWTSVTDFMYLALIRWLCVVECTWLTRFGWLSWLSELGWL